MASNKRLEYLIYGYIHNEETQGRTRVIPDGINKMILSFYPFLIKFGKFNKKHFEISEDNLVIKGIGDCGGYMIYADTSLNDNVGYRKGIHFWSVQSLPTDYNISVKVDNNETSNDNFGDETFSECFQSIGITTKSNTDISSNHFLSEGQGAVFSSFHQGHRGHWAHYEIITVVLNCDKSKVIYYKSKKFEQTMGEKIKEEKIPIGLSYYFALSCCGSCSWTKVKVVDIPAFVYNIDFQLTELKFLSCFNSVSASMNLSRKKKSNVNNTNNNNESFDDDGFYAPNYDNYNDVTNQDSQYYNNNDGGDYVDPNYVPENNYSDEWNTNEEDYYPKPKPKEKKTRFVRPRPKHTANAPVSIPRPPTSFQPNYGNQSQQGGINSNTSSQQNGSGLNFQSLVSDGITAATSAGVLPSGVTGQVGKAIIGDQIGRMLPGISGIPSVPPGMFSLAYYKYYFQVDNEYVLKKLTRLLLPFLKMSVKDWKRTRIDEISSDNTAPPPKSASFISYSYQPPIYDINSPDGYLPLMAIITYIVIMGFVVGTQSSVMINEDGDDNNNNNVASTLTFSPQVLIATGSSALVMLIIEVLLMKLGFYFIGTMAIPPYWLDIVCYAGYKLVFVTINLVFNLIFPSLIIYYIISLATGIIAAVFMIQTLRPYFRDTSQFASGPLMDVTSDNEPKKTRKIFLGVVGIAQIFFIQLMGRYTSI